MLWPNADAGSEDIARGMRKFRERFKHEHIRFYKNFPVETFVGLMLRCACMVGNSSAAVREGAFLGAPAVNIGSRQAGRERGSNVFDVDCDHGQILDAVRRQLVGGRHPSQPIYGDGQAGRRIADILAAMPRPEVQKRIRY
jgi:UDP-N-acetylglucosamine 2-epimerase